MAAQQPNIANITAGMQNIQNGFASIIRETVLLPNVPVIAGGNALAQQLAQIQQQLADLTTLIADNHTTAQGNHAIAQDNHATAQRNHTLTTAALARLEAFMANSPMRVANAAAFNTGPLRGPNGLLPPPISTRQELDRATIFQLDALNNILVINGYPAGAAGTVAAKRRAIADFLGVVI